MRAAIFSSLPLKRQHNTAFSHHNRLAMRNKKHRLILSTLLWLFKLIKKDPLILFSVLIVAACWYAYEIKVARPDMSFQGAPQIQNWQAPYQWFRTLRNDAFMLGYSDLRGNPLWVTYKITPVKANARRHSRPQRFSKDWRAINAVSHDDYLHSGYDRGHMAPNYAISRLYGKQAQLDTFLMSNITPQKPKLNQQLWQRLEEVEVKYFTALGKDIWVYTGPIFKGDTRRLKNSWRVEIPHAFYKIYALIKNNGTVKMLAFIMPQNVKGNEPLSHFLSTVDEVEQQTGLDFFADLEDTLENKLESNIHPKDWQLSKVSRLPSRYK